ncbi:hypothetical protein BU17DRAFT_89507 [Hysterangium stoloniferum]|nr:hypothetical protein BU17DRAFT_89507 [Hysterangium stoloniferum]
MSLGSLCRVSLRKKELTTISPTAKLTAIHIITTLGAQNDWELEQTDVDAARQTDAFVRPARFSQIAQCSPGEVLSCISEQPCDALSGVQPIVTGGDKQPYPANLEPSSPMAHLPYTVLLSPTVNYVAHAPIFESFVMVHQGTDVRETYEITRHSFVEITSGLSLFPPKTTLFTGVDSSTKTTTASPKLSLGPPTTYWGLSSPVFNP